MRKDFLSLLLFILYSCSSPQELEIPFKLDQGIYIPMTINGKEYDFLFDTGISGESVLSGQLVEELGLSTTDSIQSYVAAQRDVITHPVYNEMNFSIGSLRGKFTPCSISGSSLNAMGMGIISQFHWQFDFKRHKVKISRKVIPLDPLDSIRMSMPFAYKKDKDAAIVVSATLGDTIPRHFIFDTGYAMPEEWGLEEEFVFFAAQNLDTLETHFLKKNLGIAANYGAERYRFMSLSSLKINDHPLAYPVFLFDSHPENKHPRNFISLAFISGRFRVLHINPEKQEVVLAKREGDCLEYEQKKKAKFDKMVKMALEEQKQK